MTSRDFWAALLRWLRPCWRGIQLLYKMTKTESSEKRIEKWPNLYWCSWMSSHLCRLLVSASQDGKLIIWDSYTTNKVSPASCELNDVMVVSSWSQFILDLHIISRRCCHQHGNIVAAAAAFTIAPLHLSVLYISAFSKLYIACKGYTHSFSFPGSVHATHWWVTWTCSRAMLGPPALEQFVLKHFSSQPQSIKLYAQY